MTIDAPILDRPRIPRLAIGAVVFDDSVPGNPRIVLVRRGRPPLEGHWSLPGGKLEFGEKIEKALQREIHEECGLDVHVGVLIEIVEVIEPPYHYVVLDYLCRRIDGELRPGDDVTDTVYVRPSEIASYGVTDAALRVVQKALTLL
jgi:8-oxo-dGTP diphosphatase